MLQVGAGAVQQVADPYANEPKRHPALVVRSEQPFNAETPIDVLGTTKYTPNELFYVRNHLPVPHVDPATWSVSLLSLLQAFVSRLLHMVSSTALARFPYPSNAQVRVEGEGLKRVELSLKDLTTKFKKHTVSATLQCTGNRRDQFNEVKKVKGLEWGVGRFLPSFCTEHADGSAGDTCELFVSRWFCRISRRYL